MSLLIPVGVEFGCVASGSVFKVVRCTHCKGSFAYQMSRSVKSVRQDFFFLNNEAAQERDISEAERRLTHKLNQECDAVPCLHCGLYQENMLPVLRKNYQRWMNNAALVLVIPIIVLSLLTYLNITPMSQNIHMATICFIADLLLVLLAGGLLLFRQMLAGLQETDSGSPDERMKIAASRAMTIESFNALMGEKVTNWKPIPVASPIAPGHPPLKSQ